MQFMCIFHGLSDSLYTYSVTSYYVSGAMWCQLQKDLWTPFFAVVLWSMTVSFLTLFLTSLFFSHCCIGCRYLTRLVSAFQVQPVLPTSHFLEEVKTYWEQCQEFTQHGPPASSPIAISAVISMPHFNSYFWFPQFEISFLFLQSLYLLANSYFPICSPFNSREFTTFWRLYVSFKDQLTLTWLMAFFALPWHLVCVFLCHLLLFSEYLCKGLCLSLSCLFHWIIFV